MSGKVFFDTNVLIYSFSEDELIKQKKAIGILNLYSDKIIVSTQVTNELSNILLKKFKLSPSTVENAILEIDNVLSVVSFDVKTQVKALRLKNKYQFQYYDALIVATALENGCDTLFSEDMQHNQVIEEQLKILNPFL